MPALPESVFTDLEATEAGSSGVDQQDVTAGSQQSRPASRDNEAAQTRRTWGLPQNADLPLVNTIGEAINHVTDIMDAQIGRAIDMGTLPNEPISGDAASRSVFFTLLPETYQRRVFLKLAANSRAWPRLRALFGAPPYSFLGPQDAGLLRAAGIASSRANMAYDSNTIANYSQFGSGQLIDESDREYRVVDKSATEKDPLPCNLEGGRSEYVELVVRIQKRSRGERIRRLNDLKLKKTIMFPLPGEKLNLTETKRLLVIQGKRPEAATRAALKVRQVVPRGSNAATAAILATWS